MQNNNDHIINNTLNIENLIALKLILENEILMLYESNRKVDNIKLINKSDDLDIYTIFAIYNNNVEIIGEELLVKHIELLEIINSVLIRKCNHTWIDDTSYCLSCFIKQP
tara:strand:- start:225 stop:554 length:330 start_codon:yes stop_codon:yes gene_type:complete